MQDSTADSNSKRLHGAVTAMKRILRWHVQEKDTRASTTMRRWLRAQREVLLEGVPVSEHPVLLVRELPVMPASSRLREARLRREDQRSWGAARLVEKVVVKRRDPKAEKVGRVGVE